MKNIVLIGMPASGKSTIGVVLAKTLGIGFVDTDLIIQQREKRLLQDIIDNEGLIAFLDAEQNAILSIKCDNTVISTGGSAVFRENAMKKLKKNGIIVFIDVPLNILSQRLDNIKTRGIACEKGQSIEKIYEERLPLYKKYADVSIKADNENVEQTVEKLIELLHKN